MPITLRDYLTFPFNGGKGIRASQIADVDVPVLATNVDDLKTGRLGYTWRYAVRRSQDFTGDDFVHLLESAASGFPELTTPAFAGANTYFGAVAIPLAELEAAVEHDRFFGIDILSGDFNYRRREEPLYILGVPHRAWIGRFYLNPASDSELPLKLVPKPRLSRYPRYAIATAPAGVPAFGDAWGKAYSPVVPTGSYSGSRFVHLLLPHGTTPAPTWMAWNADGQGNIAGSFAATGVLQMVDSIPYAEYSSAAALDQPADVDELIVLPERADIAYFSPPTVLDQSDLGFTWYAGFYGYTISPHDHPENPVTTAVVQNADHVVSGSTPQLTLPGGPWDNSEYIPVPGVNTRYVRFIAQPQARDDVSGLIDIRLPYLSYDSLADVEASAEESFTRNWRLQANTVEIGGVTHEVWLNRQNQNLHNTAFGGATIYTFRG